MCRGNSLYCGHGIAACTIRVNNASCIIVIPLVIKQLSQRNCAVVHVCCYTTVLVCNKRGNPAPQTVTSDLHRVVSHRTIFLLNNACQFHTLSVALGTCVHAKSNGEICGEIFRTGHGTPEGDNDLASLGVVQDQTFITCEQFVDSEPSGLCISFKDSAKASAVLVVVRCICYSRKLFYSRPHILAAHLQNNRTGLGRFDTIVH